MNYSALEFLVTFPVFLGVYWLLPRRARLLALVLGSFAFYAYGEPAGVPVLIAVILVTYLGGLGIRRWPRATLGIVTVGVSVLLVDLASFKYAAFVASLLSIDDSRLRLVAPLGISFFTFEAISYLVDLKRGVTTVDRSPLRIALFIAVFPHLISGPIMRANQFLPQLRRRIEWHLPTFVSGLELFVEGFVKKRILADPAGVIASRVFSAPAQASTLEAWLAALAYTVQIYGDFAGYTDMGRGAARMLGLELPRNFDAPYAAASLRDFWRRWHISLSSWLRDYLYVSLGGNRLGELRTYLNLLVTMLLGGLWHGAGWTFVAWGGYHGVLLAVERATQWPERLPRWIAGAATLLLVVHGWVLFRAQDFATFLTVLEAMYVPRGGRLLDPLEEVFALGAFAIVLTVMVAYRMRPAALERLREQDALKGALYGAAAVGVLLLAPTATKPFIYFRF